MCAAFFARHRPGFDHREAGLHEHDQEAGDQHPHHVDREQVVGDAVVETGNRQCGRIIVTGAGGRRGPVAGRAAGGIGPLRRLTLGDGAAVVIGQQRAAAGVSAAAAGVSAAGAAASCALRPFSGEDSHRECGRHQHYWPPEFSSCRFCLSTHNKRLPFQKDGNAPAASPSAGYNKRPPNGERQKRESRKAAPRQRSPCLGIAGMAIDEQDVRAATRLVIAANPRNA